MFALDFPVVLLERAFIEEQRNDRFEGDTVYALVGPVFPRVPSESHHRPKDYFSVDCAHTAVKTILYVQLNARQRVLQVGDDVLHVLDAD